ncbi:hypothetical protein EMMF5_001889 [Cystobasidiomycetes sp. EMM_F5]
MWLKRCCCTHVSGSAFKLVNARAYHHGTMLIDARLGDLKGVLSSRKDGMISKGVESVPSPVKNLNHWDNMLDHNKFFDAVAGQFTSVYGGTHQIQEVNESQLKEKDYVRRVYDELQTWDWQWGQTPEFTQSLTGEFAWGSLVGR